VLVAFIMLPLMLVLLTAFISFDSLVKIQHDQYPDAWQAAGSPWGFFWRPRGSGFAGSFWRGWLSMKWTFVTPEWVRADERARSLLHRMRICVAVWNVGVVVVGVVTVTTQLR
jgi:hypothetical protein